jgi:hypothetical protein
VWKHHAADFPVVRESNEMVDLFGSHRAFSLDFLLSFFARFLDLFRVTWATALASHRHDARLWTTIAEQ